jgi:hypothetical protein
LPERKGRKAGYLENWSTLGDTAEVKIEYLG